MPTPIKTGLGNGLESASLVGGIRKQMVVGQKWDGVMNISLSYQVWCSIYDTFVYNFNETIYGIAASPH